LANRFDKGELTEAVKHLAFDVHHFRCYLQLYREGRLFACAPTVRQATYYSLLLHLRVLLDFFSDGERNNDCRAHHFQELPEFQKAFKSGSLPPPADAKTVSTNLNKRLAHFTATRWRETAPSMDFYEKYFSDIDTLVGRFQSMLPDDVREVFTTTLGEWEKMHSGNIDCLAQPRA
jgi:hypothetical protein